MLDHMTMAELDALESPLVEVPLFYVEPTPDKPLDPRKWPEEFRQREFVAYVRRKHPGIILSSFANEGKRGARLAAKMKGQGLLAGMADLTCIWDGGTAFIEFKGWQASGRPGKLSAQQIETLNRIHRNGHPVGCFFTATAALDFLRRCGAPIPERGSV